MTVAEIVRAAAFGIYYADRHSASSIASTAAFGGMTAEQREAYERRIRLDAMQAAELAALAYQRASEEREA